MSNDYSDINNYIMKKDIGEGNFGKVKLAIFKPTGEEFAIKILNKKKIKKQMKNQITKEKEILAKLNHINIVFVYKIIDTEEEYYIVMEYCKLGELFDYIVKMKRLSEEESAVFFYQLINGVEYIHSKGFAHRDLKPENILLTEDKVLKIIDFGLSHEYNEEQLLKTKCGSPSYAAPEIISRPNYNGFKIDIWCCGIILYAMLCGYLPFEGNSESDNNNIQLFRNILDCEIELPEFLSEISKHLICKILNPEPNERISIKNIKKHPFYLKGKKLCKIDYTYTEEIIKTRESFYKNNNSEENNKNINNLTKDKSSYIENNEINNVITEGNIKLNAKNSIDILSNNKYKFTINDENNYFSSSIDNNIDKVAKYKLQLINLRAKNKQKNEVNSFKKKYNPIKLYKYKQKNNETLNNKLQQILTTETNENNHYGLPFIRLRDAETIFNCLLSKKSKPNNDTSINNSNNAIKGEDENKFINYYKSPIKYGPQIPSKINKNSLEFKINSCQKNKRQNLLDTNQLILENIKQKIENNNINININNNNNNILLSNLYQNQKKCGDALKEKKMNINTISHIENGNQKGINSFSPGNISLSLTNENTLNRRKKFNRYNFQYNYKFNTSPKKKILIKDLYTETLNSTNNIDNLINNKEKEIKTIVPTNIQHSVKKIIKKISRGENKNITKSPEIKSIYNNIKINININSNIDNKSRDKKIEKLRTINSNNKVQYSYNINPQKKDIDKKQYMLTDSNKDIKLNNDAFRSIVMSPNKNIINSCEGSNRRKGISLPKNHFKNARFNLSKIIQKAKNQNLNSKENEMVKKNKSFLDNINSLGNEESTNNKNINEGNNGIMNINDKKKKKDDLLRFILFDSKNNDKTKLNVNNHFLPKLKDHIYNTHSNETNI